MTRLALSHLRQPRPQQDPRACLRAAPGTLLALSMSVVAHLLHVMIILRTMHKLCPCDHPHPHPPLPLWPL